MTKRQTIKIACEYAKQHGYDPLQYDTTIERVGDLWHVFFQGKKLRPGEFFSIFIEDKTGMVKELVPGK